MRHFWELLQIGRITLLQSAMDRQVTCDSCPALPCPAVKLSLVGEVGAHRMGASRWMGYEDWISDGVDMRLLASPDGRGLTAWMRPCGWTRLLSCVLD
jgi:hypothetical protein